ncbi:MAG: hypothetical protein R3218_05275, partial [Christiangramia sp.]|nr:hypothetical protein [Christiangramia sp.]
MKSKVLFILIALVVVSCGPSTQITGSWTADNIASKGPYKKVYIAALTPNANAQNSLENNLAIAARERGIEAVTSQKSFTRTFTKDNQPSKTEIL